MQVNNNASANIDVQGLESYKDIITGDTSRRAGRVRNAYVIRDTNDLAGKTEALNRANYKWSIDSCKITYCVATPNYYYGSTLKNERPIGTRPGGQRDGNTWDDMNNLVEDLIGMDNNPNMNINSFGRPGKVERALARISRENNCDPAQAKRIFLELVMKYNVGMNGISNDCASLKPDDQIDIPLDANGEINIHPDEPPVYPAVEHFKQFCNHIQNPWGKSSSYLARGKSQDENGQSLVWGIEANIPKKPRNYDKTEVTYYPGFGRAPITIRGMDAINYLKGTLLNVRDANGVVHTVSAFDIPGLNIPDTASHSNNEGWFSWLPWL